MEQSLKNLHTHIIIHIFLQPMYIAVADNANFSDTTHYYLKCKSQKLVTST